MIEGDKWAEENMKFHETKKQWADIVRDNPDLQGRSPFFQRGTRLAYLRNRGMDYHNDLLSAWNSNGELKNSNDPDSVERWKQEYRTDWIKENIGDFDDVELYENFIPKVTEAENTVFKLHEEHRLRATVEEREDAYTTEIAKSMSTEIWQESTPEARGVILQGILDDALSEGMGYKRANDLMAGAVADLVVHYGVEELELFDALDHVVTNDDVNGTLGKTGSVRKMRTKLVEMLEDRRWKKENQEYNKEQRHKEKATTNFLYDLQGVILTNKNNEDFSITDWLAEQREAGKLWGVNANVVQGAISLNASIRNADADGELDFEVALDLRERVMTSPGMQLTKDIGEAVRSGQIDDTFALQLMDDIESTQRFRGQLEDDYFRNTKRWINDELIVRTDDGIETRDSKTRARNAQLHFYDDAIEFLKRKDSEGVMLDRRVLRDELQRIAKRIVQDPLYHSQPLKEAWGDKGQDFRDPALIKAQGNDVKYVSPTDVLEAPDASIYDFNTVRMFLNPGQLDAAATEFEQNGGGLAKQMADKLGIDPVVLLKAQATFWNAVYHTPEELQQTADEQKAADEADALHEQQAQDWDYVSENPELFSPQELWDAAVAAYTRGGYTYSMKGIGDAQALLESLGIEINMNEVNTE